MVYLTKSDSIVENPCNTHILMARAKKQFSDFDLTNANLVDDELFLLEELLRDEAYEKSEKRLYPFFTQFWNTFDPQPLVNNWHLECLCEHIQAAYNRDIRRLIINIPPRSSKSTTASICSPVWWWLNHSYEKVWLISHSAKLFVQNIVYARRILDHPLYKERWLDKTSPHYRYSLAADVNTKTRIENMSGGYLLGGSPTSGALGMGYTVAILDDILDSEASNSLIEIENVNQWYSQTFMNRSNDRQNDVTIIVMQRLAGNDLTRYVQDTYAEEDWFVLNLPAKFDNERTFISPIGYNDKRTRNNQLLDPIRLPDEYLLAQAKKPIIYNTRYQQNPEAEGDGNRVKAEWLQESAKRPEQYTVMMTIWDLSFKESPEASYTVGLVMARWNDEYHVIDMFRKQCGIPEQLDAIRRFKKKYPRALIGVEAKANGHAAMSLLEREINNIYAFEPRKFGGSKEDRLNAVLEYFRRKKVFFYNPFKADEKLDPSYNVETIKSELKAFPIGKSDDIVDCISYGIQYLAEYGQESMGIVTGGERIKLQDEDWLSRYTESSDNSGQYGIFSDVASYDQMKEIVSFF